jgi:protein-S-isoprenylcysteine O-methyltransferase Ste14
MELNRYQKICGIGPLGAGVSLAVFAGVWVVNGLLGRPAILNNPLVLRIIAGSILLAGIGLHLWTGHTLQNWWKDGKLCTAGPFRFFRHPLYAAWISFIVPAVALLFNSWIILLWPPALHPFWHLLVRREEQMMETLFGDDYRQYAAQTGRFLPRAR